VATAKYVLDRGDREPMVSARAGKAGDGLLVADDDCVEVDYLGSATRNTGEKCRHGRRACR